MHSSSSRTQESNLLCPLQQWKSSLESYDKLRELEQLIKDAQNHKAVLGTKDLLDRIRLKERNKDRRDEMLKRLKHCNEKFEMMARLSQPAEFHVDGIHALPEARSKKMPGFYYHKRRNLGEKAHQVLARHWNCKCPSPHGEAHLSLEHIPNARDECARFDIWFCIANGPDDKSRWQESDLFAEYDS